MVPVKTVKKQKYELQLIVETFLILEKILDAKGGLALTEICQCTQITKNKAFRILTTLVQCGILEKDTRSNYKIGITSIEYAHRILAKESSLDRIQSIMENLSKKINEAVYFAKHNGYETVLVNYVDCCQPIKATSFVGAKLHFPTVARGTTVAVIGDITVDTEGQFADITTVSRPFFNGDGVAIGALVVLAPTYRMTPQRIKTEIVPALRDVMLCQKVPLYDSSQEGLVLIFPPAEHEYSKYSHLAPEISTKRSKAVGMAAV